jgi:hypothetical protein
MLSKNPHLSDDELLQTADGELDSGRAAAARDHFAACWECRARMAALERTITDFVQVHHRSFDSRLPPIAGPRALLKARLAESQQPLEPRSDRWWHLFVPTNVIPTSARGFAAACVLALLILLGLGILQRQAKGNKSSTVAYAGLVPDKSLTPGATRPVAIRDICSVNHDEVVPVSGTVEQRVFQEYGMRGRAAANYEVDYLITPSLGGTDDIRNLWPQPRYNTAWNSFVKDQLENYLHQSVCGGKLSLATAQKDVTTDWISAYKKYFHTDEPLSRDDPAPSNRTNSAQLVRLVGFTFSGQET